MNFEEVVGKQTGVDCVANCLAEFGFAGKATIPHNETDAYLNREDLGISLLFKEAGYISEQSGAALSSDAPVLTAIFLYGSGDDEYSEYKGALPGGLNFSDSQEQARAKLGPALKFNEARGLEIWELRDKIRLFVLYKDDLKSIARVQFGVLWK